MGEFVIALLLAFLGLLGFGIYKSNKLKEQKIKMQETEAKAAIRENQMEVIHEVREELKIIEEEKPPQETAPPSSGDSNSRIQRLNQLHNN